MHRYRSSWLLITMTCLGVAMLGFGCERTISDGDFMTSPSDPAESGDSDPLEDDGSFTDEL